MGRSIGGTLGTGWELGLRGCEAAYAGNGSRQAGGADEISDCGTSLKDLRGAPWFHRSLRNHFEIITEFDRGRFGIGFA